MGAYVATYTFDTVEDVIAAVSLRGGNSDRQGCSSKSGGTLYSLSATTSEPTEVLGALIGGLVGGPPGAVGGEIIGSTVGVGVNVSFVPSTNRWYLGPTVVFSPGLGGGNGGTLTRTVVPPGQNPNAIAQGMSYSLTSQPLPFWGFTATYSPNNGPPVLGSAFGTRVPLSGGPSFGLCVHNCGCS